MPDCHYVLSLGCPDRTGIVARISAFLAEAGGWITEAAYHSDPDTGWFFTRQVVRADSLPFSVDGLRNRFTLVAAELGSETDWRVLDSGQRRRLVVLISKEAHCLYDLLERSASGESPAELRAAVGSHPNMARVTEAHGIPYHHVPFPKDADGKRQAFDEVARLVDAEEPDTIVLARFMQILPTRLVDAWAGRTLNIHHSFLPSFIGARPYHQAHMRGVKLVGATRHYVTADLDEGPIIEQDVIGWTTATPSATSSARVVTWRRPCWPAGCAGTWRTGCWCTVGAPWCFADQPCVNRISLVPCPFGPCAGPARPRAWLGGRAAG